MITPAVIESIHEFHTRDYTIRVWMEQASVSDDYRDDEADLSDIINKRSYFDKGKLALCVLEMPRVNAVEVKETRCGRGIVLYKDWP